ncbi:MAG: peptidoglycan DD-metalloendopeptidase family protein [Myxococcota bacterium]
MKSGNVQDAARGLESFFLRELLKEARPASGGIMGSGAGGANFQDMLEETLSDQMAKSGGVGIAAMVERELGGEGPKAATPKPLPHPMRAQGSVAVKATAHQAVRTEPVIGGSSPPAGLQSLRSLRAYQSSGFGARIDPINHTESTHAGVDVAAPEGSAVGAAFDGVVVRAEKAGGYGNLVVVDHGDGTETRYAHLSEIHAKVGQHVRAGETVGAVGHTGRATGPHLHVEVRHAGVAVDPHSLFDPLKLIR